MSALASAELEAYRNALVLGQFDHVPGANILALDADLGPILVDPGELLVVVLVVLQNSVDMVPELLH